MRPIAEAIVGIVFILACFAACNPNVVVKLVEAKNCEVSR